jgi:hypothetical protein
MPLTRSCLLSCFALFANKVPPATAHRVLRGPKRECIPSYEVFSCNKTDSFNVPDSVTSSETDPLRDGAVLLLRFGELLLRAEGLVALCRISSLVLFSTGLELVAGFRSSQTPSGKPWGCCKCYVPAS